MRWLLPVLLLVGVGALVWIMQAHDAGTVAGGAPGVQLVRLQAPDLETAAIARGLVRDPGDRDIVGLYARDTDRVCVVRTGGSYRIGAFVDYNDGIACTGAGEVRRSGSRIDVMLGEGCRFEGRFEGDRIVFPGRIPDACQKLCGGRASFAALDVSRLSESQSEASAMRTSAGKLPCTS